MKGYVQGIGSVAAGNDDFRRVLYTARNCQLVVMSLEPQEDIGAEVHKLDQFFRVEQGHGEAVLDGVKTTIKAGYAVVVPAGARHNIVNTGTESLKLYTIYSPTSRRRGPSPARGCGGRCRTLGGHDVGIPLRTQMIGTNFDGVSCAFEFSRHIQQRALSNDAAYRHTPPSPAAPA